jgi:predicted nucleotidyltransferase
MAVDIQQAREFLRRRQAKQQALLSERFAEAWRDFRAIVALIIEKYNPRTIHQWGSLLHREHFSVASDIDLAVEGITEPGRFFALYGEADRLTRFPLDLVAMEKIEPEFAEMIRQHGVVVYERDNAGGGAA